MVSTTNKRKGESLNSLLPSKKVGFKTVTTRGKNGRKDASPECELSSKVSIQIAKKEDCRVLPETLKDCKLLLKHLEEKKHTFFTYGDKTERLFKVVLKDLSSNYKSPEEIKIE